MKTKDHAQLCAATIGVHTVLELFALIAVGLFFGVFSAIAVPEIQKEAARTGDHVPVGALSGIFGLIFGLAACLILVRVVLGAFAAFGVWKARPWAKVVGAISCALSCLSFPFGTAVGAYGLWFIFGPQGTAWFAGGEVPVAPVAPVVRR